MSDSQVDLITKESQIQGLEIKNSEEIEQKDEKLETQFGDLSLNSILKDLNKIKVHQHLDATEVCLGWERNNRYSLCNEAGDQILYAYEVAQCYTRQCYGSLREFSLVLTDNDDNRLLHLHRPVRCSSRCFYACCHLQEMSINFPSKENIGRVYERWSCCIPHYELEDEHGSLQFHIEGEYCHCRCCCDVGFKIKNTEGEQCASVRKIWGGCKELIGACNDFVISYSSGLTSSDKSAILGAAFLLDFNYFQRHGKCF